MANELIETLKEAFRYSWSQKSFPTKKISADRLDLILNIFKSVLQAWFVAIGSLYTSIVYFKIVNAISVLIYLIIGLTSILLLFYNFLKKRAFAKLYTHIIATLTSNGILTLILFLITLNSNNTTLLGQRDFLFIVFIFLLIALVLIVNIYAKSVK